MCKGCNRVREYPIRRRASSSIFLHRRSIFYTNLKISLRLFCKIPYNTQFPNSCCIRYAVSVRIVGIPPRTSSSTVHCHPAAVLQSGIPHHRGSLRTFTAVRISRRSYQRKAPQSVCFAGLIYPGSYLLPEPAIAGVGLGVAAQQRRRVAGPVVRQDARRL